MTKPPGIEATLRLLEDLRNAVVESATRTKVLEEALRQKREVDQRRNEAVLNSDRDQLTQALAQADLTLKEAGEAAEVRHRQRATRIRDARRTLQKTASERSEATEGQRKYDLQRQMLRATRERDAALAAADATLAEFQAGLATHEALLERLERQARESMGAYGRSFLDLLSAANSENPPDLSPAEDQLAADLGVTLATAEEELVRFRRHPGPKLSRLWPLWLILALAPLPAVPLLQQAGVTWFSWSRAATVAVAAVAVGFIIHWAGRRAVAPIARAIAVILARARLLHHAAREKSLETHRWSRHMAEGEHERITAICNQEWNQTISHAAENRKRLPEQIAQRVARSQSRNDRILGTTRIRLARHHTAAGERLKADAALRSLQRSREFEERRQELLSDADAHRRRLQTEQDDRLIPLMDAIQSALAEGAPLAPPPDEQGWTEWTPAAAFPEAVRIGQAEVDVAELAGVPLPGPVGGAVAVPSRFALPLVLTFPDEGSLLIETNPAERPEAIATLNQVILRLLAGAPPGRVAFTILDPIGLGQSFAGFMRLSDDAEQVINGRIWTQTSQIEERLAELNDHLEKVIQMYLRNEYASIAEYNRQAGNIAEKYHFLAIADFPAGFSDLALRRLLSIVTSGPRCGVHVLIHRDLQQPIPPGFPLAELRQAAACLERRGNVLALDDRPLPGVTVRLDRPPAPEVAATFIDRVARASIDANRVEVPFSQVTPPDSELWSLDTAAEIRVPIGRTGATKLQQLALGRGTRQHALIAGKTGSGKSTLFHVIITNLALWCRPEQVEFYLVDFKKGVEFKCYAIHRLPHARVVAIESDRDFGLSVLQRVDEELRRRGDLFRRHGAQDLAGYRKTGGTEATPRLLLLIDEFQEFFVEEDRIAQNAAVLLDRIVRQGRAFGIHVILGSQTLGGAYTVARSTLGQMVVRIALQCNEADAYLIMDDENPAPRLLSRPGEGIYNDAAGAREGNSPFQAVWLPNDVRDLHLRRIRSVADGEPHHYPGPLVFEGDAPGDVRENLELQRLLDTAPATAPTRARTWLGAPNSIKGPTEAAFERQSGSNLLVIGQRDDAILAIQTIALVALASQFPAGTARFVVLEGAAPDSTGGTPIESVLRTLPHEVEFARAGDVESVLGRLHADLRRRSESEGSAASPTTFLVIHELHLLKKLRLDDDFGFSAADATPHPGMQLREIVGEGPTLGFHTLTSCDTYANVTRFLGRKALAECSMRVLFQMSANDSASLIDSPAASRLGMHRALLYQEREGLLELFRPYAIPDPAWFESAMVALRRPATPVTTAG